MNKKNKILIIALAIIIAAAVVFIIYTAKPSQPAPTPMAVSKESNSDQAAAPAASSFLPPLDHPAERVSKKPFGIYITPAASPVQPERFTGYHTGVDFEILSREENEEVPVTAVCSGELILKRFVSGYGGSIAQKCELEGEPIIVLYGHLKFSSISKNLNDELSIGEKIGILGKGGSTETDGERKHLHLGFVKGSAINFKGYVPAASELSGWLDPCAYVCGK